MYMYLKRCLPQCVWTVHYNNEHIHGLFDSCVRTKPQEILGDNVCVAEVLMPLTHLHFSVIIDLWSHAQRGLTL